MSIGARNNAFTLIAPKILDSIITDVEIIISLGVLPPIKYKTKGMWDTGATMTGISRSLVEKLGLVSIGNGSVSTPNGERYVDAYCIDLMLPNDVSIPNLVTMCIDTKQGTDLLIGMDVISQGDFSITNANGKTYFSFRIPSIENNDYTV